MTNDGRECGGEVVRRDISGGKGGSRVSGCGVYGDSGWMMDVCVVGEDDGYLLSGGESVCGGIRFTFFLARLLGWGLGGF